MKTSLVVIALAIATLAGCTATPDRALSRYAGCYTMVAGGFNEWLDLDLGPDGSYRLYHKLFACVIGPNGEMPMHHSQETGTWIVEDGAIVLQPKSQTENFPNQHVFVPVLARRLSPRERLIGRQLVSAVAPDRLVLQKTRTLKLPEEVKSASEFHP